MAEKKIGIQHPIKWVIAIGIGFGLVAAYKEAAPVARILVKNSPSKYRSFSVGFGLMKWYQKFNPYSLASALHECMSGITTSDPCLPLWNKILILNQNEIRGLHNAWHKSINSRESLYDWIRAEDTTTAQQLQTKKEIKRRFNMSGVGIRNAFIPPAKISPFENSSDSIEP